MKGKGTRLQWFPWRMLLALGVVIAFAGCAQEKENGPSADEKAAGVVFHEQHGLRVPEAAAKFIGLRIADVEERAVAATIQFPARIFRAAGERQVAARHSASAKPSQASALVAASQGRVLEEGMKASATSADGGLFSGEIISLNREVGHQVEITLQLKDERARLENGAVVAMTVPLSRERTALSVPRTALLQTIEGDFVYTVSGEDFVRTPIQLGVLSDHFVEVADGLYSGDQIVVEAVMALWMAELQAIRGGKACADGD